MSHIKRKASVAAKREKQAAEAALAEAREGYTQQYRAMGLLPHVDCNMACDMPLPRLPRELLEHYTSFLLFRVGSLELTVHQLSEQVQRQGQQLAALSVAK